MTINRAIRRKEQALARKDAANARGESVLDLGFRKLKLKVTLGAMADAEDEFSCDFSEIEAHLGSTRNIAKFIAILAKAAGEEVDADEIERIRRCDLDVRELMARIAAATGGGASEGNAPAPSA